MPEFLVKGIEIGGKYDPPGDVMSSYHGPKEYDIDESYKWVNEEVKDWGGQEVESEKIQLLPHIKKGILTPGNIASCHTLDGFIIGNALISDFYGKRQKIQIAGNPEKEERIDGMLKDLRRSRPLINYREYWNEMEGIVKNINFQRNRDSIEGEVGKLLE